MIVETTRMINSELVGQMSRILILVENKIGLKSQILHAIESPITEYILPQLQSSLGMLDSGLNAKMDLRSTGLHRNPEVKTSCKTREN